MAEPEAFEIVGVYDDRLSPGRVPSVHVNVQVRGSIADLVNDSRDLSALCNASRLYWNT
jgi:hypothetical protein